MSKITRVDVARFVLDIDRDLKVSTRARKPGPPERIDGEWHRLSVVEPALLVHITPGPRGEHRPLKTAPR